MFGIPTSKELTDDGIALEDHAIAKLQALANQLLDRLNGTKLVMIDGGVEIVIPIMKE